MALLTSHIGMCAIQLERREIVVKGGRFPTRDGMTDAAILTKFPLMLIILLMTGKTGRVSTLKHLIDVAVNAFHFGMLAFQLKSRKVVIKGSRFPTRGLVTGAAILPELSIMLIIFLVT